MSKAAEVAWLLDAADVEEIQRDLKRQNSAAGSVVVNPKVEVEEKRGRSKRITIPADDVRPAQASPVESSWVTMLYPVDVDALVDEAFSKSPLASVPAAPTKDDDIDDDIDVDIDDDIDVDIDVDIEFDEVPSVERQEATSGEIAVPDVPASPKEEAPDAAEPSVAVAPHAAAPTPMPADAPLSVPPTTEAATPPPMPRQASRPPPLPLSAFTGESEKIEKIEEPAEATAADARASAPLPVPSVVVEQVSEEDADEAAFEVEDSTAVDEMQPLAFPDDSTPPPIPLEAATQLPTSDSAASSEEAPSEADATPAPGSGDALVASPPQIPIDAKAGAPPAPAASPPSVPAADPPSVPAADPPSVPAGPEAALKKKRPKKFKKPWFEDFFDDDYLRTIPFMTPSYTVKEMEYISSHLDLPKGAKLLDVGCGYGRLAIEFARAGYEVTGLDTSLPLMFLAAEASTEAGLEVNFIHQDMREMSFNNEFDGVYCVMTSFGYFDDDTNRDVVSLMHRALKPGGKLFIEVINRDFILSDLPSRVWWEGDDCVVMDEVEFNFLTSRIVSKRSVAFSDGRSINHDLSIRAYCLHELGRMLHNSGFRVVSVTGNINTDNRFFGQHSPFLIVLSEKPK